jgi:hypothetical protein
MLFWDYAPWLKAGRFMISAELDLSGARFLQSWFELPRSEHGWYRANVKAD